MFLKSYLYLFFFECGYLVSELLRILGSLVVDELLLNVGHDLALHLQAHCALLLQLPPLIAHFTLVGTVFLQQLRRGRKGSKHGRET